MPPAYIQSCVELVDQRLVLQRSSRASLAVVEPIKRRASERATPTNAAWLKIGSLCPSRSSSGCMRCRRGEGFWRPGELAEERDTTTVAGRHHPRSAHDLRHEPDTARQRHCGKERHEEREVGHDAILQVIPRNVSASATRLVEAAANRPSITTTRPIPPPMPGVAASAANAAPATASAARKPLTHRAWTEVELEESR